MSGFTARQRLSKVAFGQAHRLDVLIAAEDAFPDGLISLSGLASALSVSPSVLQAPLRDLLGTGALRTATFREMAAAGLTQDDARGKKFYVRNQESLFWGLARQLAAMADAEGVVAPAGRAVG